MKPKNVKQKMNRLIALILTLAIVLSIMPATAAQSEEPQSYTYTTPIVVNENTYITSDTSEALFPAPHENPITTTTINTANRPFRCGDVNGDGVIDIDDVLEILKYMVNDATSVIFNESVPSRWAAEICRGMPGGQAVGTPPDINDVLQILMYMAGIEESVLMSCECYYEARITFEPNGGEVSPTSMIIYKSTRIGEMPIPTRDGYNFAGWFSHPTEGMQVFPTTFASASITVWARWTNENVLFLDRWEWYTPAPALSLDVGVVSNGEWILSSDSDWITLSPGSGTDNDNFTVSVTQNNTGAERIGTVTVTGGGIERTLIVRQAAAVLIISPEETWNVPPELTPDAASRDISVTSDVDWIVNTSATWIAVSPESGTGDGDFTISVNPNHTGVARTATVTVTGGGLERTITVNQPPTILTVSPSMFGLSRLAGSQDIAVVSNTNWTVMK